MMGTPSGQASTILYKLEPVSSPHDNYTRSQGVNNRATGPAAQGPKPTVVLVHGGFTDASAWDRVIKQLQNDGCSVVAPANPLPGLQTDFAYLASVLDTLSGPVILVGASEGGIIVSNAAAMTGPYKTWGSGGCCGKLGGSRVTMQSAIQHGGFDVE